MSRYLSPRNANALMGAWQNIVGAQQSVNLVGHQYAGHPNHLHHGPYGGHRPREFHPHPGGGYGWPAYGNYHGGHWAQAQMAEPMGGPPVQQYWDPGYAPQAPAPYSVPPRNMLVERRPPDRADRILLPMSSGVNILPNTSAQITSRPQNVAFRPERIIIGGTPGDWIVNDIKVGNRSQFSQSGDVPGETFASTAIDSFVSFETVQTAMDFVMLVTFVGVSESGAPFVCSVLGTAAI